MTNGLKSEVKHLHDLLQHRNKWYLDYSCPDDEYFTTIAEIAKENADATLSEISLNALYGRYKRWLEELPPVTVIKGEYEEKFFDNFLSDVAYSLAEKSLHGNERKVFQESINLFIRFL